MAEERLSLGVDLGGTKIEAAVVALGGDGSPSARLRRRVPTKRERGYDAILEEVHGLAATVAEEGGLDLGRVPLGIGMPGGVTGAGLVKNSNTTCLNGRPFRADLEARFGRPLDFENDANCFALAEARFGAARDHGGDEGVVFGAILGTGVGGGVVVGGRIWPGRQGIAGEWGHHAVFAGRGEPCYCGQRGCLESFASGPAVEADYARRSGRALPLAEIADRRRSDAHAGAAIDRMLDAFSRGLANVIDILDPTAVVLGGGASNLDLLYDEGAARVAERVFTDRLDTPILRHALGDSAGVLGAALLPLTRTADRPRASR